LSVAFDEAVEEEVVDALGLCVGRVAGVEIGGIGFDYEDEVRGIVWRVRAGREEKSREKKEERITQRRPDPVGVNAEHRGEVEE
jgi:hypothetical protein